MLMKIYHGNLHRYFTDEWHVKYKRFIHDFVSKAVAAVSRLGEKTNVRKRKQHQSWGTNPTFLAVEI